MGSAPNAAYLEEDTDSYRHLQPPVHYLLDRKLEVDFYGRCEPLVKRHALYDIASMETASTEGHVSQDVVRGDTFMSVDGERLLTVSLPCDEECDTDYENSGSDSTLNRVDTQQGEGNEDAERSLISRIKSVSVNMELVLYMVVFVITNSAQPLLICMLRNKGGAPNGTYTFLIPTYLAMICVGCYPTKKSICWAHILRSVDVHYRSEHEHHVSGCALQRRAPETHFRDDVVLNLADLGVHRGERSHSNGPGHVDAARGIRACGVGCARQRVQLDHQRGRAAEEAHRGAQLGVHDGHLVARDLLPVVAGVYHSAEAQAVRHA
ncbi:transporter/permease protein, putative [Babesia caballi]|uniref:Transporter/permease protein, putative n=1 Tax=Babesia caballi TaxID=5871 RepID=A0AAV4LN51_BABCB|nr:transporter/permease protein, putative [Babesia caballi]